MIIACSKGVPDIAFTPKTPEELAAQAHDLLKSETQTDRTPLAEIAHFSAKLEQALANKNLSENEIKIAALYLQISLDKLVVNLDRVTIPEIQNMIREGIISYQELIYMYLTRIELYDKNTITLNSIISLNPNAMEEAKRADETVRKNSSAAQGMFGIPVLVKDNINYDKLPTTAGAMALAGNIPPYNATVVDNLINAGAIILGKTNLAEFAGMMDDPVISAVGGMTRHPYRPQVLIGDDPWGASPGGSSSGSAVSVAAALAPVTVGTETKGSLLGPASKSNIVTIKPTVGLISRYGIIPVQFSQDTPGPMARNVTDLAVLLNAMTSGADANDSKTSVLAETGVIGTDYTRSLRLDGLFGKRIGILNLAPYWALSEQEQENINLVIKTLEAAGVTLVKNAEGGYLQYPTNPGFQEYIDYEFKKGLNAYLAALAHNFPIKTLSDIIVYNKEHPEALAFNSQKGIMQADDVNIAEVEEKYETMIKERQELLGPKGIDALLKEYDLDAIMDIDSTDMGAIAGYPSVSVPLYYNKDNVAASVNVIFTGTKFSEALLLEIAYVVEQGTNLRLAPGLADKRELGEAFRFIMENGEDLKDFMPELNIYYDGLATQLEVDKTNIRIREFILK
jgi:amidase